MRDRLHGFLGAHGYPTDVVAEELVDPLDWQRQGWRAGTPFALAHTFRQTGPFRPPNVERRLPGLFFAGSGTVPGVGVPMVLISGKLAAAAGWRRTCRGRRGRARSGRRSTRCCARATAAVPQLTWRYGTTYYWATALLPRASAGTCTRSTPSAGSPTTSSTTRSRRRRDAAATSARAGRLRRPLPWPTWPTARRDDPVMAAVVHTVRALGIDPECFDRFFAVDGDGPDDEQLRDLGRPAGLHGGLGRGDRGDDAARAGATSPAAKAPARALGLAFQLTNFLRDVDEDLDRGRVYVPQADLRRVRRRPRRTPASTPEWRACWRFEIDRNRELYAFADTGIAMLPRRSARCVGTARVLYAQILDRIEAAGLRRLRGRARVPTWRKAATAAPILVSGPRTARCHRELRYRKDRRPMSLRTRADAAAAAARRSDSLIPGCRCGRRPRPDPDLPGAAAA